MTTSITTNTENEWMMHERRHIQQQLTKILREYESKTKTTACSQRIQQQEELSLIEKARTILKKSDATRKDISLIGCCLLHAFIYSFGNNNIPIGILRMLLEADEKLIFEKDKKGCLPLHIACSMKEAPMEVFRLLLQYDFERKTIYVRTKKSLVDGNRLPLHIACQNKNGYSRLEIIQLLLDYDIEKRTIFQKDKYRMLPLHYACDSKVNKEVDNMNQKEIIQLLLHYDIEKRTILEKAKFDMLPLHFACKNKLPIDAIQLLLQYDNNKNTILQKDQGHGLPLHYLCRNNGQIDTIKLLLDHDAEKKTIFQRNKDGYIPLHYACEIHEGEVNYNIEVIELLLHYDTIKTTIFVGISAFQLPIHLACMNENVSIEVIKLLLEHDVEKKTLYKKTCWNRLPLHYACASSSPGSIDIIKLLLEYDDIKKKTIFERDEDDKLPLHYAFSNFDTEYSSIFTYDVVELLLYHHTTAKIYYDIPFYGLKICTFISTLLEGPGSTIDEYNNNINIDDEAIPIPISIADAYIEKVENFASYCNLIESTTLLELAIKKRKCLYGIEVIVERTLEFLSDKKNQGEES